MAAGTGSDSPGPGSQQLQQEVVPVEKAVLRYRVMAYITGAVLIVLCFAGIPLQVAAHNNVIVSDVGTVHGILYLIYLVVAYLLARRLHLAIGPTLVVLLAGTVPIMTFVVERWVMRRYITPARQQQSQAAQASSTAAAH
jgi:integral membrane protein